ICSAWGLPPTATEVERLLWSEGRPRTKRDATVAIVADRRQTADWLADACHESGLRTIRAPLGRPDDEREVAAVLWEPFPGKDHKDQLSDLATLRENFAAVPIVAIAGFPRAGDCQCLLAAGAAAVLSKPVSWVDLDCQLATLLTP